MNTVKFVRKPFDVDAVQVTAENINQVAKWCEGQVLTEKTTSPSSDVHYIKVKVHSPQSERQTKAFVGDWVLYSGKGYKVYTDKAFARSFEQNSNKQGTTTNNVFVGGGGESNSSGALRASSPTNLGGTFHVE